MTTGKAPTMTTDVCPAESVYIGYEDCDDGDNRVKCMLHRLHTGPHHDTWYGIWWQTDKEVSGGV